MRIYLKIFLILLLSMITLACSPKTQYTSKHGTIMVYAWTMLTNNCTNIRFQSPKDFLREVDYYVEVISKYLNRPHWKKFYDTDKIQFEYTANGPSHVDGGYYNFRDPKARIFFNFSFKYDSAAIAHEITHIITPDQASLNEREA